MLQPLVATAKKESGAQLRGFSVTPPVVMTGGCPAVGVGGFPNVLMSRTPLLVLSSKYSPAPLQLLRNGWTYTLVPAAGIVTGVGPVFGIWLPLESSSTVALVQMIGEVCSG